MSESTRAESFHSVRSCECISLDRSSSMNVWVDRKLRDIPRGGSIPDPDPAFSPGIGSPSDPAVNPASKDPGLNARRVVKTIGDGKSHHEHETTGAFCMPTWSFAMRRRKQPT
jgi:hypothetical protein